MSSINGIGTKFIGGADVGKDGSYITTKWLTIVIPIVPLGSLRVLPQSETTAYFPVFYSNSKFVARSVPLYWPQVFKVYATYLAFVLFLYTAERLTGRNANHSALNPLLSSFVAGALSIAAVRVSRSIRQINTMTNIIIMLAVMTMSLLLAANISATPEVSWRYMYYFWAAFAIFSIITFLRGDNHEDIEQKARR